MGDGSALAALPKKFSSSTADKEVWESVDPTKPTLFPDSSPAPAHTRPTSIAASVGGTATVTNTSGGVTLSSAGGDTEIQLSYAAARVSGVNGSLRIIGTSAAVQASDISGPVDVETSYDGVRLSEIGGAVTVRNGDGRVVLEIRDDGSGVSGPPGLGLTTTRQRLETVGGGMDLRKDNSGTLFRAWVPVQLEEDDT